MKSKMLLLLFFPIFLYAQIQNVKINSSGSDHEEVAIAINPKNPNIMAGGANIQYLYTSTNGGSTWLQKNMSSTLGVWGDPSLVYDGLNNLYYAHLSNPISGYWIDRIVVQKSTDNGNTWNDGSGIGYRYPKNQDKEWLAVNLSNGPYKNHVYVTWTEFDNYGSSASTDSTRILFSKSSDQGQTWSQPAWVSDKGGNCVDEDLTVEGAVPCVGPNGEIYVSWAGPLGIMFDKSTNGGGTFGQDVFVSDMPGGWDFMVPGIQRCNGMPITACDTSNSMFRGNIYIVWGDQRNGTSNTDVFFIKSTNQGQTWTGFKRVNDDNTDRHQFFPWMTIDQVTGFIYVVFYDRRATTGSATDVYVACSRDGGATFENIKVSQSSFTPNSAVFFGDYTNIAAFNRQIRPMWMRMDNSALSVWTALMTDTVAVPGAPVLVAPANNSFNQPATLSCVWSPVTNALGYQIQIGLDAALTSLVVNDSTTAAVAFTAINLSASTKYYWRVRAKLTNGFSTWSQVWNFTVGGNCLTVQTASGWNLVSVPLTVTNNTVAALFPNANSPAYSFANGYQTAQSLTTGTGYWIRFPEAASSSICGQTVTSNTIAVSAGWNLIGPFHTEITASQIISNPAGNLSPFIYGYQGNYTLASTLVPGKAYWIKATQQGSITLQSTVKQMAPVNELYNGAIPLHITDAAGNMANVYYQKSVTNCELPPLPPPGVFDVRFESNQLFSSLSDQSVISVQGFKNPLVLSSEDQTFNIVAVATGRLLGSVRPGNPLTIALSPEEKISAVPVILPNSLQLYQNYPNPFNPSTTIGFHLPQSGTVVIKVFNALGEEMSTLIDGWKEAGEHEVEFNAAGLPNGMYIYRISFNGMVQSCRMLLLK